MAEADRSPSEEGSETGKRKEPVKDRRASSSQVDVGEGTEGDDEDHRIQRAVGAIDIGEDLGSITLLGQGRKSTGAAVDARDAEGEDGHQNDDVHERIKALEAGVLADEHEGGGVDVDEGVSTQQVLVVVGDEQADEKQAQNVEQGDTPEHLLDGTRQRLDGVLGLGGGETDELGAGEGEGGRDEAGAETAETVGESTGRVPQLGAGVVVVAGTLGTAAENHDEADDQEDDGGAELEGRCPEFFFGVAEGAPDVDDDNCDEEDCDPDGCFRHHQ